MGSQCSGTSANHTVDMFLVCRSGFLSSTLNADTTKVPFKASIMNFSLFGGDFSVKATA